MSFSAYSTTRVSHLFHRIASINTITFFAGCLNESACNSHFSFLCISNVSFYLLCSAAYPFFLFITPPLLLFHLLWSLADHLFSCFHFCLCPQPRYNFLTEQTAGKFYSFIYFLLQVFILFILFSLLSLIKAFLPKYWVTIVFRNYFAVFIVTFISFLSLTIRFCKTPILFHLLYWYQFYLSH